MQKLSVVLVFLLAAFQANASTNCNFTSTPMEEVSEIQLVDEILVINGKIAVSLEKTQIRCGAHGKRERFEGSESGYQVILKDCTEDDRLEGHLIDSVRQKIADIECK